MNHKGVTLVEVMVSTFIAAILMTAIFPLFHTAYQIWEKEKTRISAVRHCEQIYDILEKQLKTAETKEAEHLLHEVWEELGEHYSSEQRIEIELEEENEGFLSLKVTVWSQEDTVICEKKGTVLVLNLTLEEIPDA